MGLQHKALSRLLVLMHPTQGAQPDSLGVRLAQWKVILFLFFLFAFIFFLSFLMEKN